MAQAKPLTRGLSSKRWRRLQISNLDPKCNFSGILADTFSIPNALFPFSWEKMQGHVWKRPPLIRLPAFTHPSRLKLLLNYKLESWRCPEQLGCYASQSVWSWYPWQKKSRHLKEKARGGCGKLVLRLRYSSESRSTTEWIYGARLGSGRGDLQAGAWKPIPIHCLAFSIHR